MVSLASAEPASHVHEPTLRKVSGRKIGHLTPEHDVEEVRMRPCLHGDPYGHDVLPGRSLPKIGGGNEAVDELDLVDRLSPALGRDAAFVVVVLLRIVCTSVVCWIDATVERRLTAERNRSRRNGVSLLVVNSSVFLTHISDLKLTHPVFPIIVAIFSK